MDRSEYETLYAVEEKYWWFCGQRFLLKHLLQKDYGSRRDLRLLDAGCGTGLTLQFLSSFGSVRGVDVAAEALEFCQKRGLQITQGNILQVPFADGSFDVVTALGVFYHKNIPDDVAGFQEIYRVLASGGRFYMTDSAMKCLYGKHDIAFHGLRRYSRRELREKLEKAGFVVEKISYFNMLLFPLVYCKRKLEKWSPALPESEVKQDISPILNWLLKKLYCAELFFVSYFNYPFGINIVAVAKKK